MSPDLTPEQASALRSLLAQHTTTHPELEALLPPAQDPRLVWSSPGRSAKVPGHIWFEATIRPGTEAYVRVDIPNQNMDSADCIITATALLDAAAGLEGWSEVQCVGKGCAAEYRAVKRRLKRIQSHL